MTSTVTSFAQYTNVEVKVLVKCIKKTLAGHA